ncbi:MAG TPA: metallophosphoesterase [Candidatus Absconditabacterales bacterium]|nr:metallophosphoesterase [Candidatus Absconditabacterales bacterium]
MLLIGDIHINTKMKHTILEELKKTINGRPEEKNIIFGGDFVYHFSYDRAALLEFFMYCIDLFKQGKTVYLLAGNHDRLSQHFVYEEAKQSFDILNQNSENQIFFITKPRATSIEGQEILFLPFTIHESDITSFSPELAQNLDTRANLSVTIETLKSSENKNEQFSGHLNELIARHSQKAKNLLVIHHYYIANQQFPGIQSKFSFKDKAISADFLDHKNLKFISGHLHRAFTYKNYLCLGSFWSTTPGEINELKRVCQFSPEKELLTLQEICLNPYITVNAINEKINEKIVEETRKNIKNSHIQDIKKSDQRNSTIVTKDYPDREKISLITYNDQDISTSSSDLIEESFLSKIKELKIKKKNLEQVNNLLEQLNTQTKDFHSNRADWKKILTEFIMSRYPNNYSQYETILKELEII